MKLNIFKGRLGKEKFLIELDLDLMSFPTIPVKGELIYIPFKNQDADSIYDGETYVVNQVLTDYVHNEHNIFVDIYNWED